MTIPAVRSNGRMIDMILTYRRRRGGMRGSYSPGRSRVLPDGGNAPVVAIAFTTIVKVAGAVRSPSSGPLACRRLDEQVTADVVVDDGVLATGGPVRRQRARVPERLFHADLAVPVLVGEL